MPDTSFPRTTIRVAGSTPVRLSVIDTGRVSGGRGTLVCIHGAAGNAEQWGPQIAHFRRQYRVVVPDLRGHGQSEVPEGSYSLEEFLWDFTQMLSLLQVEEPFVLLAHSFGGPIALTFAVAQPQRVSKLILVATGPEMHLNPVHEFIVKLPVSLRYLERLRKLLLPKTDAPVFVIQRVLAGTLFRWRGYAMLPLIHTPTLVIGGQWDFIVPQAMAQKTRDLLPNGRLEVVRYTRHLPHLERPEAVNRLIERFLGGQQSWRGESV